MLISDLFIRNKLDFNEILIDTKEIFKLNSNLPENVFLTQFSNFKFNEFEWLMYDEFWDLLKILSDVKKAERPIKMIDTTVLEDVTSIPLYLQKSKIICPILQINPPTQNALKQFFKIGELGVF